jgi:hypothetical protein
LEAALVLARSPDDCPEADRLAVSCLLVAARELPAQGCWELAMMLVALMAERSSDPRVSRRAVCVAAVQMVAEALGEPPSLRAYEQHRTRLGASGIVLPKAHLITRVFRGWVNALTAAGCPPRDNRRRRVDAAVHAPLVPRFTDRECIDALVAAAAELGRAPTVRAYAAWRERRLRVLRPKRMVAAVPHEDTVRRRFGTWNQALIAANLDPLSRKAPTRFSTLTARD